MNVFSKAIVDRFAKDLIYCKLFVLSSDLEFSNYVSSSISSKFYGIHDVLECDKVDFGMIHLEFNSSKTEFNSHDLRNVGSFRCNIRENSIDSFNTVFDIICGFFDKNTVDSGQLPNGLNLLEGTSYDLYVEPDPAFSDENTNVNYNNSEEENTVTDGVDNNYDSSNTDLNKCEGDPISGDVFSFQDMLRLVYNS